MPRYTHDEIVIGVDEVLIDILARVVDELLYDIGKSEPLFYNKIILLQKFLKNGQKENIRRVNKPVETGRKRPDIEYFGGLIIIEVESSENTLDVGRQQLESYINEYYKDIALYGIVTTGLIWKVYRYEKGTPVRTTTWTGNEKEYEKSIVLAIKNSYVYKRLHDLIKGVLIESKAYRYEPSPDNIRSIFYPVMIYNDELIALIDKYNVRNRAIYQSYKEILLRVYGGLTGEEIDKLFATHTLLHMIVNAVTTGALRKLEELAIDPVKACSGEEIEYDITIPHLMWWREVASIDESFKLRIEEICRDVYYRALLFDLTTQLVEDVFSHIYEDFIERGLRFKIGEYYTPWWLIEFMIYRLKNSFNIDLIDKIVLDPACGSGRFLVRAFYDKVLSGEDPDKAYYEIVGLDILPLAATIARVELIIAYWRAKGKTPPGTPLIFWGDFLANEIGLGAEVVKEFSGIIKMLTEIIWEKIRELTELGKHELLLFLARIEYQLEQILRELASRRGGEEVFRTVVSIINVPGASKSTNLIDHLVSSLITKMLKSDELVQKVLELIKKYGNEIWAIPIVSELFVRFLNMIKPDIVLTNPPWLKLSELPDSQWGDKVHNYVRKKIIEKSKEIPGISRVGMSGDISAVFLDVILKVLERKGYVGIVMPAEQSYTPKSPHGAGKLLTYAVVSRYNVEGSAVYVGDVFKHGRHASVLILSVKKNG
jgi:hypothetical protein